MAATPSPLAISVMLVDDHPVMRVGLANVLSLNHGFQIVAQADDGPSALALWQKHRPDVTLLDVSMERMDGIARLLGISERTVRAHVTALLANLNAADRAQAVARGFELGLLKIGTSTGE